MPKKNRNKRKTFRGGFSFTDSWNNLTQGANSWLEKTKTKLGMSSSYSGTNYGSYGDTSGTTNQKYGDTSGSTNQTYGDTSGTTNQTYGGKKTRRRIKGGTKGYTPTTGLAAHGAHFSGPTAKPHNWVGGKTKKRFGVRKHRHTKSCKHRK